MKETLYLSQPELRSSKFQLESLTTGLLGLPQAVLEGSSDGFQETDDPVSNDPMPSGEFFKHFGGLGEYEKDVPLDEFFRENGVEPVHPNRYNYVDDPLSG